MWHITPNQESLITSIVFCGTMVGAYSWGVLGDAKGRRVGFFGTAIFTFIFGLLSAASPNYMVGSAAAPHCCRRGNQIADHPYCKTLAYFDRLVRMPYLLLLALQQPLLADTLVHLSPKHMPCP